MTKTGWCILGPGRIARRFMGGMQQVPDAYVAAIGSHTPGKGESFAESYGGKVYADYAEAIADENVDVVYVATPHSYHREHTLLALQEGKPVLCEKPLAPNADQAGQMISSAREKRLFLMEAMWTRFFPAIQRVRQWIDGGELGAVHFVTADFGFSAGVDPKSRLFSPELAGGGLLDIGVYTISFAQMILGLRPVRVSSECIMTSTGVDSRMSCMLRYEGDAYALLYSSISSTTPQEARIVGESGYIVIPRFWSPKKAYLYKKGELAEEFTGDHEGEGFQFEIEAVQRALDEAKTEQPLMPLDATLAVAETMDELRSQWGLKYPFE